MRSVCCPGWTLLSTSHPILYYKDLTRKFNLHNAYGSSAGICGMLSLLQNQASHVCLHHHTASSSRSWHQPTLRTPSVKWGQSYELKNKWKSFYPCLRNSLQTSVGIKVSQGFCLMLAWGETERLHFKHIRWGCCYSQPRDQHSWKR